MRDATGPSLYLSPVVLWVRGKDGGSVITLTTIVRQMDVIVEFSDLLFIGTWSVHDCQLHSSSVANRGSSCPTISAHKRGKPNAESELTIIPRRLERRNALLDRRPRVSSLTRDYLTEKSKTTLMQKSLSASL